MVRYHDILSALLTGLVLGAVGWQVLVHFGCVAGR